MKSVSCLLKNKCWKIAFFLTLLPAFSQADPGNQYCITPPFITAGIKPNLLLMIDNSASMYDLAYQDTSNKYCANNPTTQCTADSQCTSAGQAFCVGSYASSGGTVSKAACTTDADCQRIVPGDTCVLTGPKSSRNLCTSATVTTAITLSPIACSANSQCTSSGGTCPSGATCTWAASDTCNNTCSASRQCYDTTYTPYTTTSNYYGYFDAAATYSYDFTNNKFTSGASMPGSCTYSAGTPAYFCVNTTGTGAAEAVVGDSTGFVVSGNFLNWLTASKFDQEKKILTGGKFDTSANVLVSETRGCGGREFLKAVAGVNLTFAIHGGTPAGVGTTKNLATEYGQTYIDIYAGTYNATDCLKATNDWSKVASGVNVNLGTFSGDTKGCVGAGSSSINATDIWNHSLHNCYQGMTGGSQGYGTNQNAIEGDCKSIYATINPNEITDPNSGYSICSSVLTYTNNGTSYTGYLGACWNGTTFDNACFLTRMQNYCEVNVKTNPIADPSSTAVTTSTATASIPGFVMQQGLNNLTRVGSFKANVALAAPPSGLVDKYGSRIRLGAMSFQNNGSGSECGSTSLPCTKACYSVGTGFTTRMCIASTDCPTGSGQTCEPLPKTDGGQLISYVGAGKCSVTTATSCDVDSDCPGEYCQPSVGNHSSGLINSIGAIPATSWTPFAEAFYNAMGYFARTNNYGTNPPTSRDFNFSVLGPNTATSYNTSKNPSQFRCQSNNILLITDGMSTADRHTVSEGLAEVYASAVPYTIGTTTYRPGDAGYDSANVHGGSTCPAYSGSRSVSDLAWVAKNRNIKTLVTSGTASTATPQNSSESITTYVVYSGPQTSSQTALCDPKTLMENTAKNGGTTLFSAADPQSLYNQIDAAFSSVAAKAASGTAASILSNSEGSGANILQAVFYPQKIFENDTSVNWIGEMQNLWYYVDPYINNSTIREDTDGDLKLKLTPDYVTSFYFDNSADKTMVQRYQDANGDGAGDTAIGSPIDPDYVKSIWRAGKLLWKRNITTTGTNPDPRKIKTTINGTSLIDFSSSTYPGAYPEGPVTDNSEALALYLNVTVAQAPTLINWVHGQDYPNDTTLRKRGVDIKDPPTATTATSGIWRLGDIISSTPRVQSTVRLNSYNLPPSAGYSDKTYASFINTSDYKSRGMVYVGANDGMLHAFKLGLLTVKNGEEKATLTGSDLGREEWAYIPRNFLPFLKYLSDPHYEHLYAVDGRTLLLDASIGGGTVDDYFNQTKTVNTWRTIVIGSMGIGGATRSSCTGDVACIQTPIVDPLNSLKSLGYSSYFALDVTDQNNPQLLWEFSSDQLGFATTGPAIVRVGDRDKNGRWYAVFGNGPFGPIDTDTHQLRAGSKHPLTFFIVDLRSGVAKTITTNIDNAFAGSMIGGSIDADRRAGPGAAGNYQDDAIYAGYVKYSTTDGAWTDGGVVRIMTKESMTPDDATNPWTYSKVIDGIGPVTTSIARLQDTRSLNKNLWLFFGTGRYFYRDGTSLDDYSNRRALFGIKEPCYNTAAKPGNFLDGSCTAAVSGTLVNQTSSVAAVGASDPGWRIDLNQSTTDIGAERVVTDPVALTNGSVLFTTFKPTMDKCGYGGNSFLRILNYASGGAPSCNSLQGKVLVQLSTGEFKEISLAEAYGCPSTPIKGIVYPPPDYLPPTDGHWDVNPPVTPPPPVPVGGGKPPSDAPPVISSSTNRPVKKILHIQEH